ncbi:MAG: hypothetical protein JSR97_08730 [Verrucomicrobia bacterium]|nr:hypothetical protein [Verrucomicrobiota bacterium]
MVFFDTLKKGHQSPFQYVIYLVLFEDFPFDKGIISPINSKVFSLLFGMGLLAALSSKHLLQYAFERYSRKETGIGLLQYLQ